MFTLTFHMITFLTHARVSFDFAHDTFEDVVSVAAIPQVARVRGGLRLADEQARCLGRQGELHDILVILRVDAARVALALVLLDVVSHLHRRVDVRHVVEGRDRRP